MAEQSSWQVCCCSIGFLIAIIAIFIYSEEEKKKKETRENLEITKAIRKSQNFITNYSKRSRDAYELLGGNDHDMLVRTIIQDNSELQKYDEKDVNLQIDLEVCKRAIIFISEKMIKEFIDEGGKSDDLEYIVKYFVKNYYELKNQPLITNLNMPLEKTKIGIGDEVVEIDMKGENSTYFSVFYAYCRHAFEMGEEGELESDIREYLRDMIEQAHSDMSISDFKMKISEGKKKVTVRDTDIMNGYEFEEFVAKLMKKQGYKCEVTKSSGDQGGDIVIEKTGNRTVVQAKRYSKPVSNKAVQEVVASKKYYDCDGAWVVTNNHFTKSAKVLADKNQVRLIDRGELQTMIGRYF